MTAVNVLAAENLFEDVQIFLTTVKIFDLGHWDW